MKHPRALALAVVALAGGTPAQAGPADVLDVRVACGPTGGCVFHVSVFHADTGWEHYADRWEIVGPDGAVLARRVLQHPHVGEQPFVRSLGPVTLPADVSEAVVRAHDSEHGYGGAERTVAIPERKPSTADGG